VMAVCDGYRIPRPTRDADHYVAALKRGEMGNSERSKPTRGAAKGRNQKKIRRD